MMSRKEKPWNNLEHIISYHFHSGSVGRIHLVQPLTQPPCCSAMLQRSIIKALAALGQSYHSQKVLEQMGCAVKDEAQL